MKGEVQCCCESVCEWCSGALLFSDVFRWRSGPWCTWLWRTTTAWSTAERPWPSSERSNQWWRTLGSCCWTCDRLSSPPTSPICTLGTAASGFALISFMLSCLSCLRLLGFHAVMEESGPVIVCTNQRTKHALSSYLFLNGEDMIVKYSIWYI